MLVLSRPREGVEFCVYAYGEKTCVTVSEQGERISRSESRFSLWLCHCNQLMVQPYISLAAKE